MEDQKTDISAACGQSLSNAGLAPTTLCWNCNTEYPTDTAQCPGCCATNANYDLKSAQIEMQDKTHIDHDAEWVSDWYGDPEVINGTADCSYWRCKRCGAEDFDSPPPDGDCGDDY